MGALANHNLASLGLEQPIVAGFDHRHHFAHLARQMAQGLHRDRHAVRQRVAQLVGAEARSGACREQQANDIQACLTSQAEGSKRGLGFAAQEGSETPWRTAVISARIATAISGGVFEPM